MKRLTAMIFVISILLSGCAVKKDLIATGGSRSDGTVTLSLEYGMFQKVLYDKLQGQRLAESKCKVWGWTKPLRGGKKSHNSVYLSGLPNPGRHKSKGGIP